MPDSDTATAPCAFDLKSSLRKSSPTRNMYSAMPSCATTYSTGFDSGREQELLEVGRERA